MISINEYVVIGQRDVDKLCILACTEQRRNYKNVFHAFSRIVKEEGITNLWKGTIATMGRAVVVNVSQLATYSEAKVLIAKKSILVNFFPPFCIYLDNFKRSNL